MRKVLLLIGLATSLVALAEQSATAAGQLWKVVGDKSKSDFNAVRLNTATGQTWLMDGSMAWAPMPEKGAAPKAEEAGTYDCMAFYPAESTSWYCIRYNSRTGETWTLQDNSWTPSAVKTK
ncbi:MAG TPA: hypothetical protein VHY20_12650 [Pirellulales bacterium]|jgi:hypothetical protein|nr:hypothetical protein [Pirellulales bacterium]